MNFQNNSRERVAAFFAATFLAISLSWGAPCVYWVAADGDDSAVGTEEAPFATLTNALAHAANGSVIHVKAGSYEIKATSNANTPYLRVTNAVEIVGAEGAEKTYFDGLNQFGRYAFFIDNAGAKIRNVIVRNLNSNVYYGNLESASFNIVQGIVSNCAVIDSRFNYVGSYALKSSNAVIVDCVSSNTSCSDGLSLGAAIVTMSGSPKVIGCRVYKASAKQGAGLYVHNGTPLVSNCLFSACTANNSGRGGIGVVYLKNAGSLLVNSVIAGNGASGANKVSAAGLYLIGGTVRGCLIVDNVNSTFGNGGGVNMSAGTLESCTIVRNSSKTEAGQGIYQTGGAIRNCIVAYNDPNKLALNNGNHFKSGGTCTYTCTWPEIADEGNTTVTPYFVDNASNWRLGAGSMLFDAGQNQAWMAGAVDLDGNPRLADETVNLGCYEGATPTDRPFLCGVIANTYAGAKPLTVSFSSTVSFAPSETCTYLWTFGDGTTSTNANPQKTYEAFGSNAVHLAVTSGGMTAETDLQQPIVVGTSVVYVNSTGAGEWPYDTAAKGTNSIEVAMADLYPPANGASAKLHVGSGTFYPRALVDIAQMPLEVVGAEGATISAARMSDRQYGILCIRRSDSSVSGITLADGYSASGDGMGAVLTIYGGTVSNCVIRDSQAEAWCYSSLRMYGGTFTHGMIYNVSSGDGGVGGGGRAGFTISGSSSLFANSIISNGTSTAIGAGEISGGTISNCLFVSCSSSNGGDNFAGAVRVSGGNVIGSTFIRNKSTGGATSAVVLASGLLRGCLLADGTNTTCAPALYVLGGRVENCTVAGNRTKSVPTYVAGCRFEAGTLLNTIVYGNSDDEGNASDLVGSGIPDNCCTNDPKFLADGSYLFSLRSPARDAGLFMPWMHGATDLAGKPRLFGRAVDIGCFESDLAAGTTIEFR